MLQTVIFFHPDCTVGFGIAPNHALRLVGCTTGREFHPALKMYSIAMQFTPLFDICQVPLFEGGMFSSGKKIPEPLWFRDFLFGSG